VQLEEIVILQICDSKVYQQRGIADNRDRSGRSVR
jgi:hypothetical protein